MPPLECLQQAENLTTDQAIEWLKSQGIHTSRSGLDRARHAGRLPWLKVSGRARILYRRADLAAAFFEGIQQCHSGNSSAAPGATFTSGEPSQGKAFTKALALATGGKRKPSEPEF